MMKMMRKMMKNDYITNRSFEAFVTVIEISIFGFENLTLPIAYTLEDLYQHIDTNTTRGRILCM